MLSCGLLLYRLSNQLEVFLVHPGGPFFVNKDDGSWGVPKGLIEPGEDRLAAARARVRAKQEAGGSENSGVTSEEGNENSPEEG